MVNASSTEMNFLNVSGIKKMLCKNSYGTIKCMGTVPLQALSGRNVKQEMM